ncbi:MAG: phage head morphogenesis protein [Dokdonella sp.]|uniref:phage head morphogenesis protein n=1 Tax=Dokdonella sp. TaxID=2291710 RepID=UPI0025C232F0|nr:phage minor head protein [Dokdonella sp.]MBZ0222299.1 phage head morphogenesis protein [Dokdonella sp.]
MADIPGFVEAIRDALRRRVVLPETFYGDTIGRVRAASATVSGLAGLDQVQAVIDSLRAALAEGQSFATWKKAMLAAGHDFGLTPAHLETIFRTNLQSWYAAGRAEQIQRLKSDFPYLRYSAILDARVRPAHATLDGLILPVDHPLWRSHLPPWSWNCRCTVIPMTAAAAEDAIGKAREAGRAIDQIPHGVAMPEPSWDYDRLNPAAPLEGLEKAVARRFGLCVPRQFAVKRKGQPLWCEGPGADLLQRLHYATQYGKRDMAKNLAQKVDVLNLAAHATSERFRNQDRWVTLGAFTARAELFAAIGETALRIERVELQASYVRHAWTQHGPGGWKLPKHPIEPDDLLRVAEIANSARLVDTGRSTTGGNKLVEALVTIDGVRWIAVFEVRPGKRSKSLALFDLYKK